MTRTSRDRKIIFVLLIAFVVELFLLLAHTGVIQIGGKKSLDGVQAGRVSQSHNHLRRRNVNSLVWENSQTLEPVFFHDSILTLKESTAVLDLDTSNEVTLSENTLITVEPPDEEHAGEIRLRFVRGNLQARNPFQNSNIEGESWSVSLKSGSEVELREVGKEVEVQLKKGAGVVTAIGGAKNLQANQILRLGKSGASQISLDPSLKWANTPPKRIYLHGEALPVQIEWTGAADKLLIQTLGHDERTIDLAPGKTNFLADLDFGHHRLFLRKGSGSSPPLDVQVWRAPLIHLLFPLPRNRVDLGENVKFMWQKVPQTESFRLHVNGADKNLTSNSDSRAFNNEEDVQWYVEGVDTEGFTIPPLYRYPLFIREKPLPAPKLKLPQIRGPANDAEKPPGPGAWLWSLIVPQAQAEEKAKFEAVFSWEPVKGANQYIIEICESADFRNPIVNKTLTGTEFTWGEMQLQAYYWRVAAGHSKGRMGVFSEAVAVDFSPLKKNGAIAALDGVLIRKLQQLVPVAAPPPAAPVSSAPAKLPLVPVPLEPASKQSHLTHAQEKWRPILLWQPHYGTILVMGTEDSEAKLNGSTVPSFGFEFPWRVGDGTMWFFDAAVTSYSFAPDPKETYPFQQDVGWLDYDFSFLRFKSSFGYGFSARQMVSLQRTDYEAVRTSVSLGFGPVVQKNFPQSHGDINVRAQLIFNRDGQAVILAPEWRFRIGERFVTGLGIEGTVMLDLPDMGYNVQGFATVGFPF